MIFKKLASVATVSAIAASLFAGISVTVSAKTIETALTYVTSDGSKFNTLDCDNVQSVSLSLDEGSQSAIDAAAADSSIKTITLSYDLAGGSYRTGNKAAADRNRLVVTVANKTFYFNSGTNANPNSNNTSDSDTFYVNFYSNNKPTITYTFNLNDEGNATSMEFSAPGTGLSSQKINLKAATAINQITIGSAIRSSDNTDQSALLQNFKAILITEKHAPVEVSSFDGKPYVYYDEESGEAKEAASYKDIPDTAKVISKGATFTVTPNDDTVTKVTVSCSNQNAKAITGDGKGTSKTSLDTNFSGSGSILFGILDYTTNGKSSIPSTSGVWSVEVTVTPVE